MRIYPDGQAKFSLNTENYHLLWGYLHITFSLICSWWFLYQVQIAFANDMWWSDYNTSTHQALLVDIFNSKLTMQCSGLFDISTETMSKAYASAASLTDIQPTYIRRLVWNELTSIEYAVTNLRFLSAYWSMWMFTQYCWVDFDRIYELAHTTARQQRCDSMYRQNGAMYMEAVLRNQVWDDFMQNYGGEGNMFTVSIQSWLETSSHGRDWLQQTSKAREITSEVNEVALWMSYNITIFKLQWANYWQNGVTETMQIKNALGMTQDIVLKSRPHTDEAWSSWILYWMPINDLVFAMGENRSLVRSANNSFLLEPSIDFEAYLGMQDHDGGYSAQTLGFRENIGPLCGIDAFYVSIPKDLLELYSDLHSEFMSREFESQSLQLDASPQAWTSGSYLYYGGNPLCIHMPPQKFVQQSFGFYDACDTTDPLMLSASFEAIVFAITASHAAADFCIDQHNEAECKAVMVQASNQAARWLPRYKSRFDNVVGKVSILNISIMQFASSPDQSNWTVLWQPLVTPSSWSLCGWVMLFDWIEGRREVVSMEGDAHTMVLMSNIDTADSFESNLESVQTSTRVVSYIMIYITTVLTIVGIICFVLYFITKRSKICGKNLLQFNDVVGSIWIGRPLIFIRGMTATLILSTATLKFQRSIGLNKSNFIMEPRSWPAIFIICNESTWVLFVVIDCLTVFAHQTIRSVATISYILAWLAICILESSSPVQPVASISKICSSIDMGITVQCASGVLQIGDIDRIYLIILIQAVAVLVSLALAGRLRQISSYNEKHHRYLLATADSYFISDSSREESIWKLDSASSLMAGLIYFSPSTVFDLKLWQLYMKAPLKHLTVNPSNSIKKVSTVKHRESPLAEKITIAFGVLYALGSVAGSASYLQISRVNLSNDIFWAEFNLPSAHAFIADHLNRKILLAGTESAPETLSDTNVNIIGPKSSSTTTIPTTPNFGALMQYTQLNTLELIIPGLRRTEACSVPYIYTQYCYVDFGRRWELANSIARQERCMSIRENGAVFLESILRNIDYEKFYSCWGDSYHIAIESELDRSIIGKQWLINTSTTSKLSVSDEIHYWRHNGITSYTTQWQNFKRIGLKNSYNVINAFGFDYKLTIQGQNTTFRWGRESMLKMYWGLMNDMNVVGSNQSQFVGKSLVRSSPSYVFANKTIASMMTDVKMLTFPLPESLVIVNTILGPFGSIDMHLVPCPKSFNTAVDNFHKIIRHLVRMNDTIAIALIAITDPKNLFLPAPKVWADINFVPVGGTPLCPQSRYISDSSISQGLVTLVSWDFECTESAVWASVFPTREIFLLAMILSKIIHAKEDAIPSVCAQNSQFEALCNVLIKQAINFTMEYMSEDLELLDRLGQEASNAIEALKIEFIQFGQISPTDPVVLYRLPLLDPTQVEFELFSWMYLIDWPLGYREVISFEGDNGKMVLLSEFSKPVQDQVNMAESPLSVASYLRSAVVYVTCIMMILSAMALVYFVLSYGHVEILNLFELQRVGAVIWVGRPLLLLRSITAIGLLSTCTLKLHYNGFITYFEVVQDPWYKTLLAANEVTWLVAVVNDIAIFMTREYTVYYVTINSVLVWLSTAILSILYPVTHELKLSKVCELTQVDFQVTCASGWLKIGDPQRVITLMGIVLGLNATCYIFCRLVVRKPRQSPVNSFFMYASAKYLFLTSKWIQDDVYYMDRVSALLNGIVTIRWKNRMYGLDIKLWHVIHVDLPDKSTTNLTTALLIAYPLQLNEPCSEFSISCTP